MLKVSLATCIAIWLSLNLSVALISAATPTPMTTPLSPTFMNHKFVRHQIQTEFSQVVGGIRFALAPRIGGYAENEPITIDLQTENSTRKNLEFDLRSDIKYQVEGPNGTLTQKTRDLTLTFRRYVNYRVPIAPGKHMAIEDNLSQMFVFSPGSYRVRATLHLPSTGAVLVSPWVAFNVS